MHQRRHQAPPTLDRTMSSTKLVKDSSTNPAPAALVASCRTGSALQCHQASCLGAARAAGAARALLLLLPCATLQLPPRPTWLMTTPQPTWLMSLMSTGPNCRLVMKLCAEIMQHLQAGSRQAAVGPVVSDAERQAAGAAGQRVRLMQLPQCSASRPGSPADGCS